MTGLQKYEEYFKINLNETCKTKENGVSDQTPNGIDSSNSDNEVAPLLRKVTLRLTLRGKVSLIKDVACEFPLSFELIKSFLSEVVCGKKHDEFQLSESWCKFKGKQHLANVAFVVIEGIGVNELKNLSNSDVKRENNLDNKEPPSKKLKSQAIPEQNFIPKFLCDTLPLSSSQFNLHLEVSRPTNSSQLLSDMFLVKMPNELRDWISERYGSFTKAYKSGVVITRQSTDDKSDRNREESIKNTALCSSPVKLEDKFDRRSLLLSLKEMMMYGYPLFIDGKKPRNDPEYTLLHPVFKKVTSESPMFGIDCEMCLTTENISELTRISVVNQDSQEIYSTFVRPQNKIKNYLTQYSGVRKKDLANTTTTLQAVQKKLREILPRDAILVGHSFENDLHAMKISHPYVIDTSIIYKLRGTNAKPGLKLLTKLFLNKDIQDGNFRGHHPTEDACSTLQLAQQKLQHNLTYGDFSLHGEMPFGFDEERRIANETKMNKMMYNSTFFSSIFALANLNGSSSALITSESSVSKFRFLNDLSDEFYLTCTSVDTQDMVLKTASNYMPTKKFIACYLTLKNSNLVEDIKKLDAQLKDFHQSLPRNSIILTLFTGSSRSGPSTEQSNGILMVDICGLKRQDFVL